MTNALRSSIHQMAADFASAVLKAIRGASLEDILTESQASGSHVAAVAPRRGPGRPRRNLPPASHAGAPAAAAAPKAAAKAERPARAGRNGRLGRRSPADIAGVVKRIVELLESHPAGLRAEQIRQTLHLQAKELPRPIADALSGHKINKVGEKRATTYFAGRSRGAAAAPAKGAKAAKATKGKAGRPAKRAKAG
jgi:hypothetical protein